MSVDALPSAALRVRLAGDVTIRTGGRLLAGGIPFRLLRLTESGAVHVRRWMGDGGGEVGVDAGGRALARRLLDNGFLLSEGCDQTREASLDLHSDVDIVVPVHNRSDQLDRCISALAETRANVIVVDDGSCDAASIAAIASRNGADLVRLEVNEGPAGARNAGLRATSRPFVAFIDSDVTVPPSSLYRLLGHFADPLVAIAAPRVLPADPDQRGWVAAYENAHSALDMGATAGDVGPGRRIPYIIGATLLARRAAIGAGFIDAMRSGEDVDLGWRVAAAGWRVVYDPVTVVHHDHRVKLIPLMRRRWTYGRSIVPLTERHPDLLAPLRANPLTVAALVSAVTGHPASAGALFTARTVMLQYRVRLDVGLTARLAARDARLTTRAVARAVRRAWSPALVVAGCRSGWARRILILASLLRLADEDQLRLRYVPLALLDDLVAALALWSACAQVRVLHPLLPRFRNVDARMSRPGFARRSIHP